MSPDRKARTADMVVGGLITLVGSIAFAFLTGAWSGKETVSAHAADLLIVRSEIRSGQDSTRAMIQRLKDAFCFGRKDVPQCN